MRVNLNATVDRFWTAIAPGVVLAMLLSVAVARYDASLTMAVVFVWGGVALLLLWPAAAVAVAVFLIYANIPAALRADIPQASMLAGAFALPLAIPAVRRFVVDFRFTFDQVTALMLVYVLVMLVSSFGAVNRSVAIDRTVQYVTEGLLLYWLLLQAVRSRRTLRAAMRTAVLTAAALASLGLYQVATGDYQQTFWGLAQRQLRHEIAAAEAGRRLAAVPGNGAVVRVADRAAGPIGDPNRHAQILLAVLPWAIYLARYARTAVGTAGMTMAGLLIMAGILITYSRGAFVAIGVLAVAAGVWKVVHRRRLIVGLAVLTIAGISLAPTYFSRVATIVKSAALFGEDPAAVDADPAIRGRATEMLAAYTAFREHPVLGVGPGQYTPFYSVKYQQRAEIQFRELPQPREPHDLFIAIGAELGVIGLATFLAIVTTVMSALRRVRRDWIARDPDLAAAATALLFSLISYLTSGLFLHLAYERYFWFLLAAAGATLQIVRAERAALAAAEQHKTQPWIPSPRLA